MSKDKLILKDGTTIELESGSSLDAIKAATENRETMLKQWEMLTPENLKEVKVQNGDGLTIGIYKELVLLSETSVVASDGSVLTTYSLREKTDTERRLEALEAGQEIQFVPPLYHMNSLPPQGRQKLTKVVLIQAYGQNTALRLSAGIQLGTATRMRIRPPAE